MSKQTLALEIAADLRNLAARIEAYAKEEQAPGDIPKVEQVQAEAPKPEPISIEKIRAILAEKSQSGKQTEVKALITKFGAKKLTDIDPTCYAELLKEAYAL
ncbi:hypothetical protein SOV_35000 [Sporomusa ovata DSM 2662]|uniref:rRNA biogenesis protein rrp5, putative n=1 Tax=Sporomusa ovata TaxID=2378 RepID=A0A0U1L7Y1_9FIRM|nr:hypothetical protein [Sporomusa ovata]EQB24649.1 hypothetical protein SOV_6c00630 [Sporomusa ovata DSM 2662]CQR74994.1 rRNA biogenesis protein rrp5, putative [Sporomusa ovata]